MKTEDKVAKTHLTVAVYCKQMISVCVSFMYA